MVLNTSDGADSVRAESMFPSFRTWLEIALIVLCLWQWREIERQKDIASGMEILASRVWISAEDYVMVSMRSCQ